MSEGGSLRVCLSILIRLRSRRCSPRSMDRLHTSVANAYFSEGRRAEGPCCERDEQAHGLGLVVNAGHGINYTNITEVIELPYLHELNVGHDRQPSAVVGIGQAVPS